MQKIVEAYEGSPESEDYSGVGSRDFSVSTAIASAAPTVSTAPASSENVDSTAFAPNAWKTSFDDGRRDELYYDEDDEASERN